MQGGTSKGKLQAPSPVVDRPSTKGAWGMKTVAALPIVLAAVVFASNAQADTPDDQFINQLSSQGITGDRGTLIGEGHAACDNYGTLGMNGVMMQIMGQGLSSGQASTVILSGMHTYCPGKAPL